MRLSGRVPPPGEMGPHAAGAIGGLSGALKDSDGYVRAQAAASLGRIAREPASVVPALMQALRDRDKNVRVAAAYALAEFGTGAPRRCDSEGNGPGEGRRHQDGGVHSVKAIEGGK